MTACGHKVGADQICGRPATIVFLLDHGRVRFARCEGHAGESREALREMFAVESWHEEAVAQ